MILGNFVLTMNLPFAPTIENCSREPSHGLNPDRSCKLSVAVCPYYPLFISQLKVTQFSPKLCRPAVRKDLSRAGVPHFSRPLREVGEPKSAQPSNRSSNTPAFACCLRPPGGPGRRSLDPRTHMPHP